MFRAPEFQPNGQAPVSSTDRPVAPKQSVDGLSVNTYAVPRRLRTDEIPAIVDEFRIAARNAMEAGEREQPIQSSQRSVLVTPFSY